MCRILLLTALIITCIASASTAEPEIIDDAALLHRLEREGGALVTQGKVPTFDQLVKGLTRIPAPISLPSEPASVASTEELYRLRRAGVLILARIYQCGKCNRQHVACATALVLSPNGTCLTNYHVFGAYPDQVVEGMVVMTSKGEILPVVEVMGGNRSDDLAVFRVEPDGVALTALPLGPSPEPGARITVIGHPADHFYSLSTGQVARHARSGQGADVVERMFITADYAKGSSGSPVFDEAGRVVGIAAVTQPVYYDQVKHDNQQMVFKACVPVHRIRRLLAGGVSAQ
jgi:S1-C subfamily serine protease